MRIPIFLSFVIFNVIRHLSNQTTRLSSIIFLEISPKICLNCTYFHSYTLKHWKFDKVTFDPWNYTKNVSTRMNLTRIEDVFLQPLLLMLVTNLTSESSFILTQRGPLLWTDFIKVCIVSSEPTHRSALAPLFCRLAVKYCHQRHSGTEFKGKRFIILLGSEEDKPWLFTTWCVL